MMKTENLEYINKFSEKKLTGLTAAEVEASRREFGSNELTPPKRDPWWKQYLEKFDDPVIRILLVAAVIATIVGIFEGDVTEGIGITIAIILATALAFINEYKANQEFDILNKVNEEVPIKVIRDGTYSVVPRKDLVKGDLVILEMGEEVPADGEVIEAVSLQIDESRLTGESHPVEKLPLERLEHKDSTFTTAYPPNKVLRGSMVADGHGIIRLTAVGDSTEIGKTARSAAEETDDETPLTKQLAKLSKVIGVVGFTTAFTTFWALVGYGIFEKELSMSLSQWLFMAAFGISLSIVLIRVWLPVVYDALELAGKNYPTPKFLEEEGIIAWTKPIGLGIGFFTLFLFTGLVTGLLPGNPKNWIDIKAGEEILKYFMIAVTIIVVAVPEGLAMSVTLSLAYSMRKMTASNNLVRRLHACETIGAATVICSDKTGTLTMNMMRVQHLDFPCLMGASVEKAPDTRERQLILEAICCNSTANLGQKKDGSLIPLGNPTEGALLLFLHENGINYQPIRERFSVFRQWTFSTERKFMGTAGISAFLGKLFLHVKGAPEILLSRCTSILLPEGIKPISEVKSEIEERLTSFQSRGMRTLAFAYLESPENLESCDLTAIAQGMIWLGFAAIADPIRPEVPSAFEKCRLAGVDVKLVTGDTSATAIEIARQAGLITKQPTPTEHMTGAQFQELSDDEAKKIVKSLKILSRARPMDKLRLVKLLKEIGEVVAVTGDGTNDAPALNHADVGLAMGKTGTSVAKEASDIILLDDSFPSIVNAIMWGRSLYLNIQKFLAFQLTINVVALGIALIGPFIGVKMPLTVIQMLWVNLIMDTFAALALATEPPNEQVMLQPPRNPEDFIVTPVMKRVIFRSAIIFLIFLIGLLLGMQLDDGLMTDRDLSIFFSVFIMLQFWNLFNVRCLGLKRSAFSQLSENSSFLIIALIIFIGQILIVTFGGNVFRTVPLSFKEWLWIIAGTSIVLWVGEIERFLKKSPVPIKSSSTTNL